MMGSLAPCGRFDRWRTSWRRARGAKLRVYPVVLAACSLGMIQNVSAWWTGSHTIVARAAAEALPNDVPAFFRQSGDTLAYFAADPDLWKNPETVHLRDADRPEHFLDWELLGGRPLPPLRWQYVALCTKLRKSPREMGLLPYALVEWTERLALAFAEQRRWPDNPNVRQKCLVYGGILSHYAADLAQPLHLTVDYDGRTRPGLPSPRTGIHSRMDALIQAAQIHPREVSSQVTPTIFRDLFTSTVQQVVFNRRAIDTVYALEGEMPFIQEGKGVDPSWRPSVRVREFALDRARSAAFLTASCWLTAWARSGEIEPHAPLHDTSVELDTPGRPTTR